MRFDRIGGRNLQEDVMIDRIHIIKVARNMLIHAGEVTDHVRSRLSNHGISVEEVYNGNV